MSIFRKRTNLLEAEINDPVEPLDQDTEADLISPSAQPAQPAVRPKPDVTPVTDLGVKPDISKKIKLLKTLTDNMLDGTKIKIMLAGDTGIGKTSFVKDFCQMLGMPMVLIEVPHTVEEHLINIPFIIVDKDGRSTRDVEFIDTEDNQDKSQPDSYDITLARSNLVTVLEKHKKIPDAEYPAHVARLPDDVQEMLAEFNRLYPREIARARAKTDRILFLDEYFRQTSRSIRNSLRNLLDYRIGNDVLPRGTYIMYASNTKDKGLDAQQSQHSEFFSYEFDSPSVTGWLTRMIKGSTGRNIAFKRDVVDAFMRSMKDEHLSLERIEGQVRISPRRWSEILLQINSAYPFEDPREVSLLLTTLKRQFQNDIDDLDPKQKTATHTAAWGILQDMLAELMYKSGVEPSKLKNVPAGDWRDVVAHNVFQKAKLGTAKKYIPVISGPPGIGKTALGDTFESPPYNMRFIVVNCTDLDPDSVVGVPVSKVRVGENGEERVTEFSRPSLYIKINQLMEANRKAYAEDLKELEDKGELEGRSAAEVYRDWEEQEFKYVIFFDEINRVKDLTVFNSLRRLILEKEFNHEYKLPDDVIVVGAMNPVDKGTIGMTDHFKDSIDIIDAEPEWSKTISHIKGHTDRLVTKEGYDKLAVDTAYKIIERFPDAFMEKNKKHKNYQFYLKVGDANEIYINPRNYYELFLALSYSINSAIEGLVDRQAAGEKITNEEANTVICNAAIEKWQGLFNWLFFKSGDQVFPDFWRRIYRFLKDTVDVSLTKKVETSTFGAIIDSAISEDGTPLADDPSFFNYMKSYMPATFYKDFFAYIDDVTSKFMNHDGTEINVDEAVPFLVTGQKGSLYDICRELVDAVNANKYETGIFDQIDEVVFQTLSKANRAITYNTDNDDAIETAITKMLENYDNIRSLF